MNKTLYLATSSGVMISADAGESWQNASRSLDGMLLRASRLRIGLSWLELEMASIAPQIWVFPGNRPR